MGTIHIRDGSDTRRFESERLAGTMTIVIEDGVPHVYTDDEDDAVSPDRDGAADDHPGDAAVGEPVEGGSHDGFWEWLEPRAFTYQCDQDESVSEAITIAVGAVTGTEPSDLEPLYSVVEAEALDRMFGGDRRTPGRPSQQIRFAYAGLDVGVGNDGRIHVTEPPDVTD